MTAQGQCDQMLEQKVAIFPKVAKAVYTFLFNMPQKLPDEGLLIDNKISWKLAQKLSLIL